MIPLHIIAASKRRPAPPSGVKDDFNRADGPLGANWETLLGTAAIASNRATRTSGDARIRHIDNLGTDHWAQVTVTNTSHDSNALVRVVDSGKFYMGRYLSGKYEIYICNATFSLLASLTEAAPAAPFTLRLEAQGSTLRLYSGGVLKVTATNSVHTTGTQAGIRMATAGAVLDDYDSGAL